MTYSWRSTLAILSIGAATAGALACGGGNDATSNTKTGSAVITADGSSTVYPITEAVAEEFQAANAGTRVTVGSSGTGGGFQKFCRDETDISDASRPVKAAELEACTAAGIEF